MRLIDADELIELIDDDIAAHKDGYFEDFELPPTAYGSLCALRMVREYINALPTVEAEPFKAFAEWVASEVCTEDFEDKWSLGAFAERACRKLWVLGVVQKFRDEWVYVDKDELDGGANG